MRNLLLLLQLFFVHVVFVSSHIISKRAIDESISARIERVLTAHPIIDGHNDVPFTLKKMFENDVSRFDFESNLRDAPFYKEIASSHTDLPRLRKGKVGGQFWSAYVRCNTQYKDAVERLLEQIDVVYKLVEKYPNDLQLATSSQDIEAALKTGKIASLIGVEGGHTINSNLAILRTFYKLGARYMTMSHSCNTPWIDTANVELNATDDLEPEVRGVSEFGVHVIREMNRLGMMVDLSHVSTDAMRQALRVSEAPVIFSHSGPRAVLDHPRNVPDDVLEILPLRDGIIMINFYSCYVIQNCSDTNLGTIKDVVKQIDYVRRITGSADHIGIGADYNGVSKVPVGLEDVSKYPALFEALLTESEFTWSDEDLAKVANLNILRVFKKVEEVRDRLRDEKKPADNTVLKYYQEPANAELTRGAAEPNPAGQCASGVKRYPVEEKVLAKGKNFVYQQKYY